MNRSSDVLLARVTSLVALVAVAVQGCAGGDRPAAPDAGPVPVASPAAPEAPAPPEPTASAAATAAPGPAPAYEPTRFRPASYDEWLTVIPAALTVDAHLPEAGGDVDRGRTGVSMRFCGVEAFGTGAQVDRRIASASGPEYGESRDLRLFADDRAAHRFVRDIPGLVAGCPASGSPGNGSRHEVRGSWLEADESFTVVQSHYESGGLPVLGGNFWEVARVGNAVLLTATGGEYEPTTSLDPGIRRHAAEVAGIVDQMCVFSAAPCVRAPVRGSSTHPTVVGPHGLGRIHLGATAGEIRAFGGEVTRHRTGSGCRVVDLWVNDAPDLVGNLEPGLGLSVIHVRTEGRTDLGVGTGSPWAEVVAAYPDGEGDRQLYAADVAGYDDRHWRFWFGPDGTVDEFMLLLHAQHCGG